MDESKAKWIKQTPENYWHYHLSMVDVDNPMLELTIYQETDKHVVYDDWGTFGDEDAKLGEFDTLKEALVFSYKKMLGKYPNAQFCTGAGCPPDVLIEQVKKEIGYVERP